MVAPLVIEGGITFESGITIGPEPIPTGPTTPTNQYWLMDAGYVGNGLALGPAGAWNNPPPYNPPYIEAFAINPESSIALGTLTSGQSLYDYNPQVMFTVYINTEDPQDVPLNLAAVGIAYHSVDLNNPLGNDASSWAWYQDGTIWYNGSQANSWNLSWTAGDYLDVALNLNLNKAWMRVNGGDWNGRPDADPVAGTHGQTLYMVTNGSAGSGTDIYPAVNPGAQNYIDAIDVSLYTYSIPSGYTAI